MVAAVYGAAMTVYKPEVTYIRRISKRDAPESGLRTLR
jgi:hypothetical protein